jgi:hypothetical protein
MKCTYRKRPEEEIDAGFQVVDVRVRESQSSKVVETMVQDFLELLSFVHVEASSLA